MNRLSFVSVAALVLVTAIHVHGAPIQKDDKQTSPPSDREMITVMIGALSGRNSDLAKEEAAQKKIEAEQLTKIAIERRLKRDAIRIGDPQLLKQAVERENIANGDRVWAKFQAKQKRIEQEKNRREVRDLQAEAKGKGIRLSETAVDQLGKDFKGIGKDGTHTNPLGAIRGGGKTDLSDIEPRRLGSDGDSATRIPPRHKITLKGNKAFDSLRKIDARQRSRLLGNDEDEKQILSSAFDSARTFRDQKSSAAIKVLQDKLDEYQRQIQTYQLTGATSEQVDTLNALIRKNVEDQRGYGVLIQIGETVTINVDDD